MPSICARAFVYGAVLATVACGGGGSDAPVHVEDPDPLPLGLVAEADCLGNGLEEARRALFGLAALHRRIQDAGYTPAAPNSVDLDLGTDPDTFEVSWDVDGDGSVAEVSLSGELVAGDDLADGLDPGEYVDVAWVLEVDGTERGSGDYRVTRLGSNQLRIDGSATFDGPGCKFEITSADMTVNNIDFLDATPDGFLNVRTNDGVLLGLLTFQPPSRVASLSVRFDDRILDLDFDLDSGEINLD